MTAAEAADLLPWYATGALSPDERALIDEHLAADAGLRVELALHRRLAGVLATDGVETEAAADTAMTERALAEAKARIAASGNRSGGAASLGRLLDRAIDGLRDAWATTPRALAGGLAAGLAAVVATAVWLTLPGAPEPSGSTPTYRTATDPQTGAANAGPLLAVRLRQPASATDISALLAKYRLRQEGPTVNGVLRLRPEADANVPDLVRLLQAEAIVALVTAPPAP